MIAPMVDILLVVLVFFIVTWNFALSENELDVRVPTATKANEATAHAHHATRGEAYRPYHHQPPRTASVTAVSAVAISPGCQPSSPVPA